MSDFKEIVENSNEEWRTDEPKDFGHYAVKIRLGNDIIIGTAKWEGEWNADVVAWKRIENEV